jgi:hypothetical protein
MGEEGRSSREGGCHRCRSIRQSSSTAWYRDHVVSSAMVVQLQAGSSSVIKVGLSDRVAVHLAMPAIRDTALCLGLRERINHLVPVHRHYDSLVGSG